MFLKSIKMNNTNPIQKKYNNTLTIIKSNDSAEKYHST